MWMLALACKTPEDTAVPTCSETPRSIQVGPNEEPFTPFEDRASVQALPGGGFAIDALARVGGLLVQDDQGLHSLYVDIDVESENSTTGTEGEHRVECLAGYALVPLVIPAPVKDAEQMLATVTLSDEQETSAFAQLSLRLDWP